MIEPFKTTSIIIDDPGVSITKTFDGDMFFRDKFVAGVKLKDLLGGGPIVIDPAVIILVETSDYTYIPSEETYGVDVPHNFGFIGNKKYGIIVEIYDENFEKVGVEEVKSKENSVYIRVSSPENLAVVMKRVV